MTTVLPLSAAAAPPGDLGEITEWFESLSYGLVLLEPYPLDDLRHAVRAYHRSMVRHVAARGEEPALRADLTPPWDVLERVVESDHHRFETSFEQLGWFLRVVEGEDHGGHRQALGQYGRLVAEAVRRHLLDEDRLDSYLRAAAKR